MMNEKELNRLLSGIVPPDEEAMTAARERWNALAKPLGSLGLLEDAVVQLAGIQRSSLVKIKPRALIVFCADNGVVAEGISQSGSEVTATVAGNFLQDKTCVAILCRQYDVDLVPVDIGMSADVPGIRKEKIICGTNNIANGPAMTRQQALDAIAVGMRIAHEYKEAGYELLAVGEMGIGNTTTSSAMAASFLGLPIKQLTGRGAGLSNDGLERKIRIIEEAIRRMRPNPEDPLDVLSKVGGLDIAGMCGLMLGGAVYGIPVVLDGFIAAIAAYTAVRLSPACAPYLLASHVSTEPAARILLKRLGKKAMLTCELHLGEGSGAVLALPLVDGALAVYDQMSDFAEAGIEQYKDYSA